MWAQADPGEIFAMMLQSFIRQYIAPAIFLTSYLLTVVLGNIIYATPIGGTFLALGYLPDTPLTLPGVFSPLYWLLLLAPFLVTPLVVLATRRLLRRPIALIAITALPDINRIVYVIATVAVIGAATYMLLRSGALDLFFTGTNAVQAVEARFLLQERLGFWGLVTVQSLLPFLGYLALVNGLKGRGHFWQAAAVVVCAVATVFLLLLNMKWPILLFFCGIALAVFVHSASRPYLKAGVAFIAIVAAYLLISTFLFRAVETPVDAPIQIEADALDGNLEHVAEVNARLFSSAFWAAPRLVVFAINRMAVIYPYYLSTFSSNPGVCGNLVTYLRPGADCRPSTFIYQRMFVSDGFEGRGTAPAAVHITAFALGGLPLAGIALVLASIVMGMFAALPRQSNATVGAIAILGAIAGYHWSQIPGEGPLLYDHGLIWPFLLLAAMLTVQWMSSVVLTQARRRDFARRP